MYDFWYALGAAVINHPTMLDAIKKVQPTFNKLDSRTIIEVDTQGKTFVFTNRSNAGLLDPERTRVVRAAIRDFLKGNPAAPPISIYTAGRFCQFMSPEFSIFEPAMTFWDWMDIVHKAYLDAGGQTQGMSARFPALIGLCTVDREFARTLRGQGAPAQAAMLPGFLDEFSIKPNPGTEFQIAQKFVSAPRVNLSDGSGLWQTACPGDQIAFMDPENQRAILAD